MDARQSTQKDNDIQKAVVNAIGLDPRIKPGKVQVGVDDGMVFLKGRVKNLKARQAAENDAKNTVGVKRVKNRIDLISGTAKDDNRLQQIIENAFVRAPYVQSYELSVFVDAGVAKLYGVVETYFEKVRAHELAENVSGIRSVENHIVVIQPYRPEKGGKNAPVCWVSFA